MKENTNLKPTSELFEKHGLDVDSIDANEGDELIITEVCRKGDLVLYESDDEDAGPIISQETVSELFPDYELDHRKYYLIEKDGEFYYE